MELWVRYHDHPYNLDELHGLILSSYLDHFIIKLYEACEKYKKMMLLFLITPTFFLMYFFPNHLAFIFNAAVMIFFLYNIFRIKLSCIPQIEILKLQSFLQKLEEIKKSGLKRLLDKEVAELKKLCEQAESVVPIEFYDQFPFTDESMERMLVQHPDISFKPIFDHPDYWHFLRKSELIKMSVEKLINIKCVESREKKV